MDTPGSRGPIGDALLDAMLRQPGALQQFMQLGTLDERSGLLDQQRARLDALRRSAPQIDYQHGKGAPLAIAGLMNVGTNVLTGLHDRDLAAQQTGYLHDKDVARTELAKLLTANADGRSPLNAEDSGLYGAESDTGSPSYSQASVAAPSGEEQMMRAFTPGSGPAQPDGIPPQMAGPGAGMNAILQQLLRNRGVLPGSGAPADEPQQGGGVPFGFGA